MFYPFKVENVCKSNQFRKYSRECENTAKRFGKKNPE